MSPRTTKSRMLSTLTALLVVAVIAAGCTNSGATAPGATASVVGTPQRGGTVTVSVGFDAVTLDSMKITGNDVTGHKVTYSIYDELTRWDYPTGKLIPGLATSWKQVDPLTWEFTLRQGVQFQKGYGELTSDDVAFTVNYIVKNKTGPAGTYYTFVTGATAVDKYTVRYTLSRPYIPFLVTTTAGTAGKIVSRKAFEEKGDAVFDRDPVGTGPFEFVEWVKGDHITLKRFDKYWNADKIYLDGLTFKIVPDPFVAEQLLKTGSVQLVDGPVYKDIDALKTTNGLQVLSIPIYGADYININVTRPPFDKKEVRQAISYALDRQAIVDAIYAGHAQADDNVLTVGFMANEPPQSVYGKTANLDKAKALLASVGLSGGFSASAMVEQIDTNVREIQVVADQLSKIGIKVQINPVDTATFNKQGVGNGAAMPYDFYLADFTFVNTDADSPLYNFVHGGAVVTHGYANAEVDKLLDDARAELDAAKRVQLYRRAIAIVLDEQPLIYLAHKEVLRPATSKLRGYTPAQKSTVMYFDGAWLSK